MAQTCALPGMPQVPAAHPDPRRHLQPPNPQTGQHHLRLHLPQLPAQMHPPRRRQKPQQSHPPLEPPRQPPSKERTTRNTICATLTTITLTLCTALAGCGSASEPSTPAHAVKPIDSQCTDGGTTHGFYECVITLQDTRKVNCVVYAWEKQGGMSCDWDHVSGADKEPAR